MSLTLSQVGADAALLSGRRTDVTLTVHNLRALVYTTQKTRFGRSINKLRQSDETCFLLKIDLCINNTTSCDDNIHTALFQQRRHCQDHMPDAAACMFQIVMGAEHLQFNSSTRAPSTFRYTGCHSHVQRETLCRVLATVYIALVLGIACSIQCPAS
jgi:hypothetical protein